MNFWDTVAGHNFTQYTIPSLIEAINNLSSKKQYTIVTNNDTKAHEIIKREIDNGSRFINYYRSIEPVDITLIFEK